MEVLKSILEEELKNSRRRVFAFEVALDKLLQVAYYNTIN